MSTMPRTPAVTRLTLLPSRPRGDQSPSVRRYRVARLQLVDDVVAARANRFEHLKRPHD